MCCGDFNELVSQPKKSGGALRPESQMHSFRQVIDDYGFTELQASNGLFTWADHRGSVRLVREKLDRVLVTPTGWICSRFR